MQRGRISFNAGLSDVIPWPLPIRRVEPAMAVCPIGVPMSPAAMQEIYRVAYERALAAAQPSVYQRATLVTSN